jgi:hypothetical protein
MTSFTLADYLILAAVFAITGLLTYLGGRLALAILDRLTRTEDA